MVDLAKRIIEAVTDVEQWRREMLDELQERGGDLKVEAERLLGERVDGVWVIGSVLNSRAFTARSDVDIAVKVTRPSEEIHSEQSEELAGRLFAMGSALDVGLYVNEDPDGLRVA